MTPGAGVFVLQHGHMRHILKMRYFFYNLLYTQAYTRQIKYKAMMSKDESTTKIVNFITPVLFKYMRCSDNKSV